MRKIMLWKSLVLFFLLVNSNSLLAQIQIGAAVNGNTSGDDFGKTVVLSSTGNTMAVGAVQFSRRGPGYVKTYRLTGNVWQQLGQTVSGVSTGDMFGGALDLSSDGNTMVVGGKNNTTTFSQQGIARVYRYTGGSWQQLGQTIFGTGANIFLGNAVSISAAGDIIAISSNWAPVGGTRRGQVQIMRWNGTQWALMGSPINGQIDEAQMGTKIDLSSNGTTVAISGRIPGNNILNTLVSVYDWNGSTWVQRGSNISFSGQVYADASGGGVNISSNGSILALKNIDVINVYQWNGTSWVIRGNSIALSNVTSTSISSGGDTLVYGRAFQNSVGAAGYYVYNGSQWVATGSGLTGTQTADNFGTSVSVSSNGQIFAVGASGEASSSDANAIPGYVKVFGPSCPGVATPVITANGSTNLCPGASLFLSTSQVTGATYQWLLNGNPIPGVTSTTHLVTSAGSYSVVVTVNSCIKQSAAITVTANPCTTAFTDITSNSALVGNKHVMQVLDFDNDFDDDLIVHTNFPVGNGSFPTASGYQLLRNNGNGNYSQQVANGGLQFMTYYLKVLNADFDNNSFTDILMLAGDTVRLFMNQAGTFTDRTAVSSLAGGFINTKLGIGRSTLQELRLADVNKDGILDLVAMSREGGITKFITCHGAIGCTTAGSVTFGNPVTLYTSPLPHRYFNFVDIDNDFDMDLLVQELTATQPIPGWHYFYQNYRVLKNNGSGSFTISTGTGITTGRSESFASSGDFNNDGYADVYSGVADCCQTPNPIPLWLSNGNGTLTLNNSALPRVGNPYYELGHSIDLDLDGLQDIVWEGLASTGGAQGAKLQYHRNLGSGNFTEGAAAFNINKGSTGDCCPISVWTRSSIFDYNNDGKPDIYIESNSWNAASANQQGRWLMQNTVPGNYLQVRLRACVGVKDGDGARVRYKTGGLWYHQQVNYQNKSDQISLDYLVLGLGNRTVVDSLQVLWVGGAQTILTSISANQKIIINENPSCTAQGVTFNYNPLSDTTRVCGTSTVLDAGAGYSSYSWSTGATSRTITVANGGNYRVTVTNALGCTSSDSTLLSIISARIQQNDTTICTGSSITLTAYPVTAGIVGHYPLDNNAYDISGNGFNGFVSGAQLTTDRFGQANKAYEFNGTSNFIRVNHNASFNTLPLTVSCWFNARQQIAPQGALVGKYSAGSGNGWQITMNETGPLNDHFDPWYFRSWSDRVLGGGFQSGPITDSTWHHVAVVFDSTQGKLYMDGSLIATKTWEGSPGPCTTGIPIYFGYYPSSTNNLFFRGKIDDVRIYNTALSTDDVRYAMNSNTSTLQYLWSNGATTPTIQVSPSQSTTYYVTITDGITTCTDSVRVSVLTDNYNPLSDTTRVCGTRAVLDAGSGYSTYSWNTGAVTQTITPTNGGFYRVAVTNADGCIVRDSTTLSLINARILGGDTTICRGASTTLCLDSLTWGTNTIQCLPPNSGFTAGGFNFQSIWAIREAKFVDNKIFLGGQFSQFNNSATSGFIVLNEDGSVVPGSLTNQFNAAQYGITSIEFQPDNKIIIAGEFTAYGGQNQNRLVRLNSNYSMDQSFNVGTGLNGQPWDVEIQSDGKILVGGQFTSYNGVTRRRIARLNTDGSLDQSFLGDDNPTLNNNILDISSYPDGKVLVSGPFQSYSNIASANTITRLNADGSVDNTFTSPFAASSGTVYRNHILPDGKILVGGSFIINGVSSYLLRLNSDGSIDNTFTTSLTGGIVTDFKVLPNGKILVIQTGPGGFNRLNADGSIDATFNRIFVTQTNSNTQETITVKPNGDIIAVGGFTTVNGQSNLRIFQSNSEGVIRVCRPTISWSNGQTTNCITVTPTQATTYSVTLSDGVNSCTTSVRVNVFPDNFNPLQDTTRVCGTSVVLDAGAGYSSYSWNTGATAQSIIANTGGFYRVSVTNSQGCLATDSTTLSMINAQIINQDTLICRGDSITLSLDCTNANDASGNNNNGTVYGATLSNNRFRSSNTAYLFDGQDDYIGIISTPTLRPANISISSWVKIGSDLPPNTQSLIIRSRFYGYSLMYDNITNKVSFTLHTSSNQTNSTILYSQSGVNDGNWHHVVGTFDGTMARLYIDGLKIDSSLTTSSSIYYVSDGLIAIGRDANASFYYFKGSLDDFGIWDRALSPTEVQTLYTSRPSVTWSTGANTNSITVSPNQSTTYYVTVSDGVTTCTDSVRVNVFNQNFNPLPDTLRLCGRNATLDAGEGYTTYQWNTGATTRTINVTSGGFYRVTVTNPLGCSASDSTYLSLVNARILNNDTAICVGSIIRLSIDSTFPGPLTSTVTWSTGATTNSILVNPIQSTTYSVSVTNGISTCTDDVIVNVSIVDTSLQVIGSASFCELDSAVLRAGVASSYQWLRNGVVISGATSREYVARVSGVYRVVLSTSIGCTDTSRAVTITVNPRPRAQFTTNSLVQCMRGNVFVFTNQSTLTSGAMTYQWDFGNGQTSALASPSYSYAAPGSYLVMLSVFSNAGCRDTASVVVTVNPQPVAAFTVNDSTQCINGNLFSFTNQSSISSGSISYLWNFGNGVVSAQANPQHVYTQPGNYTVTLYVTSGTGCVDSASRIMTAYPKPNPSFTVNATPQCLSGNSFVFTNTTTIAAGTVTYTWYYGNGASSVSLHGAQAYALPGVYTVKLVAVSDNGCRDSITQQVTVIGVVPQAAFTVNNPSQCLSGNSFVFTNNSTISAGTMTYAWSFGNGQTSTLVNPVHTYTQAGTYTVTLIASSTNGCRDTTRQFVIVRPQPQPSFTVNSSSQCQGTNSFVFTNTSSIATGSMTYQWRFGDGQGSTQASPTHSYTQVGTYTVTLIAVSEYGCIDSIRQAVVVNYTPSASFTINSASQCLVGNSFVFTSTSTITAGTLSYLWRLGNGATSTASTLTYSYSTAGTYTVTLVVTSNSGCRDSVQRQVVVKPNPVPSFTINDNDQCLVGNSFVFTNTSTLTAGTMQYRWRYGNGQEATTTNAAVTYAAAGTYTVTLVATSDLGCVDSVSRQVIVRPMPVGGVLSPTVTHICDGGFLTLTASGGSVYQWYLNGVAINGATAPTYNATVAGLYTVDLISAFGCLTRDTVGVQLRLIRKPVAAFTYDRYCAGTPTQFTNTSTINSSLPVSYSWLFGSNAVSTMENPVHTFIVSGFYDVQLKVVPTLCPNLADSVRRTLAVEAPLPNERYPGENAIINQPLQLSARAISRARYLWLPSIGLSNDTIVNPVFTYNREQEYRIRITTQAGCVMTDTLLVRIFSGANIFVPEGFSPNGDGVNDVLRPRLVGIRRLIHFKIFNRWGQLMYETGREGQGWDGIYQGIKQPLETYVWMIQAEDVQGNIIKRTGSTLLLR
jgi:gliding motility-associated-like protein/uncharacterized delta-60 repeat protein